MMWAICIWPASPLKSPTKLAKINSSASPILSLRYINLPPVSDSLVPSCSRTTTSITPRTPQPSFTHTHSCTHSLHYGLAYFYYLHPLPSPLGSSGCRPRRRWRSSLASFASIHWSSAIAHKEAGQSRGRPRGKPLAPILNVGLIMITNYLQVAQPKDNSAESLPVETPTVGLMSDDKFIDLEVCTLHIFWDA